MASQFRANNTQPHVTEITVVVRVATVHTTDDWLLYTHAPGDIATGSLHSDPMLEPEDLHDD